MSRIGFRSTRFAAVVGTITALVLGAAACGGSDSASSQPAGTAASGSSSTGEGRTVIVATSNDAPFAFTNDTGGLSGIDGDMITAIAKNKGWTIKPFVTDFATLIPALQAKKADIIADGMYITDERKKTINFTDVWYTQGEGLIVPADSTVKTRDDLKGKVLGAQTGTVFADFIGTLGASETKFFDSQAAIIAAVENGQIDAAITDSAVVAYSLVQKPNPKLKLVSPYTPFYPGQIGAGVRTDDTQLMADLNQGLKELKATPEYLQILKKYGLGQDNVAP